MEILITILYTIFFSFLIYKLKFFKINGFSSKLMIFAFVIKVIAGITLVLIYTFYYKTRVSADVFKYFDDGKIIFSSLKTSVSDYLRMVTGIGGDAQHLKHYYTTCNFWYKDFNYNLYNDNRTIIRFNAIAMLFSGGYLWVHTVFMSFLSFIGLTYILKVFVKFLSDKKYFLFFGIYFLPSILLWTSGVIKEGFLVFAFGLLFYNLVILLENNRFKPLKILWILLSIFLLLISKFYVLVAALPGIIAIIWIYKSNFKRIYLKFGIVYILFLLIGFNSDKINKNYNSVETIAAKQYDFYNFVGEIKHVGSKYEIPRLEPNVISIIKNSPLALFNAFVQPSPKNINSLIMIPAAFENYLIIFLLILSIIFSSYKKIKNKTLFLFSILFTFNLFIISGLTTPVIGALVRYKVPALPFLIIVILFLIDFEKLKKFFRGIKNRLLT